MSSVRWIVTGLGVGVVGGFVGGFVGRLMTRPRPETRQDRTWLPDGPGVPVRELSGPDRKLPGNPQPVAVGGPVADYGADPV
ncbi:hypothetical protein [Yinghuangia soli]|uniref:Uncharacterized protein n=1 Tax=Yinghuangia soli TaxID=2908204 RepID=A0AA41U4M5_9ACTN|nr:hypothetical protein [Yinghuangia soli]MCF2533878.1 hypothetical protein [Yinghuangia soli]